jgi:hypothetical protein
MAYTQGVLVPPEPVDTPPRCSGLPVPLREGMGFRRVRGWVLFFSLSFINVNTTAFHPGHVKPGDNLDHDNKKDETGSGNGTCTAKIVSPIPCRMNGVESDWVSSLSTGESRSDIH